MKQIVIISGKGGTGKTSLTACLAALSKKERSSPAVVVDCDVEAPNLHLLLGGSVIKTQPFSGPKLAVIDFSRVADSERCAASCKFGAISGREVDPLKCVGCGVCRLVCGPEAVKMADREAGIIIEKETPYGQLFTSELQPGQPGFGGLITALRSKGEAVAGAGPESLIILDGSPGLGCRVVASLNGCDLAVVVTEPGKGAQRDLERLLRLLRSFNILTVVVINRFDLDLNLTREVERFCRENNLMIAGKIPYHDVFMEAVLAGRPAVEMEDEPINSLMGDIYTVITRSLFG
ncbi:MAG: (4Fe-4S)-binding protein [Elusimicrobiota bacterium]|nr:(4Fe-4S)-binding protein [Elusimicrobiota bacterium]